MAAKTKAQRNQHAWVWLTRWTIRPLAYHLRSSRIYYNSEYISHDTLSMISRTVTTLTMLIEALDKDYAAYSLKLKEEKRGAKQPKH